MIRKVLISSAFFFSSIIFASEFVHPLNFKATDSEKNKVMDFIRIQVKDDYTKIGMDNPSTLRLMEQQNLDAFKKLTKAKKRKLLDKTIEQYCSIGMCNYKTIHMMYEKELSASNKKLEW